MAPLKIVSMLLKPVELALLVAGMCLVAYFTKEYHDELTEKNPTIDPYDVGAFGRNEFFLYTTGVGVGIAVLGLVCALTGRLETKHGAFAACTAQAIWTLQLLISTALVAKILTTFKKEQATGLSFCETLDKLENRKYDYNCGQLTGGVLSDERVHHQGITGVKKLYYARYSLMMEAFVRKLGKVCGFLAMIVFAVDTVISLVSYTKASK